MNKKISLGAAIAFALIIAAAVFSITMVYSLGVYNESMSSLQEREKMYQKLAEIDQKARDRYYGTFNEAQLQSNIASGYLKGLNDPYAVYYTPEEYAKIQNEDGSNQRVGIGAKLDISPDGYLLVADVYPDSPAEIANIEKDSLIIKIDEEEITSKNSLEMIDKINGPEGSKLSLVVRKGGEEKTVELTRRDVAVPTVHANYIDGGVAYIRISSFDKNTSNQFNRELKRLQDRGARSIVFDLRGNNSQELSSAIRILDRIVPSGVIYSVVDKDNNEKTTELSDTEEMTLPMVTITNKETSGAAELFVQVLKDYGKAKSVGTLTEGRGVAQEIIKLSDGSAFKVTVAQYQSMSGYSHQGIGVKPDFDVQLPTGGSDWTKLEQKSDPQLLKGVDLVTTELKAAGVMDEILEMEKQIAIKEQEEEEARRAAAEEAAVSAAEASAASSDSEGDESSDDDTSSGSEDSSTQD